MATFVVTSKPNTAPSINIVWTSDQGTSPRSGQSINVNVDYKNLADEDGDIVSSIEYEINKGSGWVMGGTVTSVTTSVSLTSGLNQIRYKITDNYGNVGYSNILEYTKQVISTSECISYEVQWTGINPGDTGIVDYIDCDGVATTTTLTWEESNGNGYAIFICAKEITNTNYFVQIYTAEIQNCIPSFTFTEISRVENTGQTIGDCSSSNVIFDITGNLTDFPLKFNMDGSPSGLQVDLSVVSGNAVIKDMSDNTTGSSYTFNQPSDNAQLTSNSNIQITSTGTSRFMLELTSTEVYRDPATLTMEDLLCATESSPNQVDTYAYISLVKDQTPNNDVVVSIGNQRKMSY